MNGWEGLLPFVLIAAVFWFLLIRPQRKRQMELLATQRNVQVGDQVMLGAGIVGRVAGEDADYLRLELTPGVEVQVARAAVVRVLVPAEPAEPTGPTESTGPTGPDGAAGPGRPADEA